MHLYRQHLTIVLEYYKGWLEFGFSVDIFIHDAALILPGSLRSNLLLSIQAKAPTRFLGFEGRKLDMLPKP
jgi:hypothetical protein